MKRLRRTITLGGLMLGAVIASGDPNGLATSFVNVFLPHVVPGKPYDMAIEQQRRIELQNYSKEAVTVQICAVVPQARDLLPNAEPVPDAAWISISPAELQIDAGDTATANLLIKLPKRKELNGRVYQVNIWSRAVPSREAGITVAPGLLSRVRFETK